MSSSTTPPSPAIGAAAVNAANPTTASSATNTTTAPLTSSDGENGIFNYPDPSVNPGYYANWPKAPPLVLPKFTMMLFDEKKKDYYQAYTLIGTQEDGVFGFAPYWDLSNRPTNVWEGPVEDETNKMYGAELRRFTNECWRSYQDVQKKIDMRSVYPRGLAYVEKMGWSEGTGLGRINQGRLLPLVSKRHDGEGGLGWRAGKPDNTNKDPNDVRVKFVKPEYTNNDPNTDPVKFVNYEIPMSSKWGIAKSRLPIPKKQTKGEADAAGIVRRKKWLDHIERDVAQGKLIARGEASPSTAFGAKGRRAVARMAKNGPSFSQLLASADAMDREAKKEGDAAQAAFDTATNANDMAAITAALSLLQIVEEKQKKASVVRAQGEELKKAREESKK